LTAKALPLSGIGAIKIGEIKPLEHGLMFNNEGLSDTSLFLVVQKLRTTVIKLFVVRSRI
jgi:hypothetical protein